MPDYIRLIPEDPFVELTAQACLKAAAYLRALAPQAAKVQVIQHEQLQLIDNGSNFESVSCPSCAQQLTVPQWQKLMDADYQSGCFQLALYALPCCAARHTVHQLHYDRPMGIARYCIEAEEPSVVLSD
jgi:hypothetical protein